MKLKRKNFLTILLIILIVIVVGVIGYLVFELVNEKIKESKSSVIVDEFDSQIPTISEEELAEEMAYNEQLENQSEMGDEGDSQSSSSGGYGSGTYNNRSYYTQGINIDGYWVVGIIRIPKTGIRYAIFSNQSKDSMERGTNLIYTSNGINQTGNSVIAGHNYKNSLFFSKNKKLVNGDSIYIKDVTGVEKQYIVYNKFVTNSTNTTFYQRDTNGIPEITLTTCTDNGLKTGERLIVVARQQ